MLKILCSQCIKEVERKDICLYCGKETKLKNRYFLLKKLGQNTGITYQALDTETKNHVVIKELVVRSLKQKKQEELFQREANTLLTLEHEQIPKFIDFFSESNGETVKYYIVMSFVFGENLLQHAMKSDYDEYRVIEVIKDVAKILSYIHSLSPSVIHRDIKPSNIVRRRRDGALVLIDFGAVAGIMKPSEELSVVGTFGYMAPEQYKGKIYKSSDYYSLGMLALFLLTKQKPEHFAQNGLKVNWQGLNVTPYMKNILSHLLEENPLARLNSYSQLLFVIDKKNFERNPNQLKQGEKFFGLYRKKNMVSTETPEQKLKRRQKALFSKKIKEELFEKREELYISSCLKEFCSFCQTLEDNKEELRVKQEYIYNHKKMLMIWGSISMFAFGIFHYDFSFLWLLLAFPFAKMAPPPKEKLIASTWVEEYVEGLNEKELVYLELFFEKILPCRLSKKEFSRELYQKLYHQVYLNRVKNKGMNVELSLKYKRLLKEKYKHVFTLENIKNIQKKKQS